MTAATWQSDAVALSVRAVRAGCHEDRHEDGIGYDSLGLIFEEMFDGHGPAGIVGLAHTLALVAGTIINAATGNESAVERLLDVYSVADVARRMDAAQ